LRLGKPPQGSNGTEVGRGKEEEVSGLLGVQAQGGKVKRARGSRKGATGDLFLSTISILAGKEVSRKGASNWDDAFHQLIALWDWRWTPTELVVEEKGEPISGGTPGSGSREEWSLAGAGYHYKV